MIARSLVVFAPNSGHCGYHKIPCSDMLKRFLSGVAVEPPKGELSKSRNEDVEALMFAMFTLFLFAPYVVGFVALALWRKWWMFGSAAVSISVSLLGKGIA
jgi:hypothetical protein